MQIYVLEDNWREGWTKVHPFGADSTKALAFLHQRERDLFPWEGPERVCYFRADSLDTLRITHGNWFHERVEVADG